MLCHAISPSHGYVKAAHDIVRHPRLGSDAKILIAYVQGLPEKWAGKALSEHAKKLGITGRAYQKAKSQLKANGFVHEWRRQGDRGLWVTDQLLSNVPLSDDEARRVRDGGAASPPVRPPSERNPAVGDPGARSVGGQLPVDEEREENSSHPPTEAPEQAGEPVGADPADPQVAEAERVLLSLRHADLQLRLGVREARSLADTAADWLRRGVNAAELRHALSRGLPEGGVRYACGFLRKRLVRMMPEPLRDEPLRDEPPASVPPAPPAVRQVIACQAAEEGAEHVFRPRGDETVCGPCSREAAWEAHTARWEPPPFDENFKAPEPLPWRERVAAIRAADAEDVGVAG
ncbi:hypothetical protein [Streptomyces sp. NPDC050392]|uniref:hypothetical protein n=1 Tax=unclassified Streptomyces TaxID=2593676 RepID=UPI0034454104|nr:hypothetical protein OG450_22700 [Streptomyces sp. NBC_01104]